MAGGLADHGAAGKTGEKFVHRELESGEVGEAGFESPVAGGGWEAIGVKLLVEPLVDSVGAEIANGGDVFGRGAKGEAVEQVEDALRRFGLIGDEFGSGGFVGQRLRGKKLAREKDAEEKGREGASG
jgi:hypothetical protein